MNSIMPQNQLRILAHTKENKSTDQSSRPRDHNGPTNPRNKSRNTDWRSGSSTQKARHLAIFARMGRAIRQDRHPCGLSNTTARTILNYLQNHQKILELHGLSARPTRTIRLCHGLFVRPSRTIRHRTTKSYHLSWTLYSRNPPHGLSVEAQRTVRAKSRTTKKNTTTNMQANPSNSTLDLTNRSMDWN
jgi:hypothetical protein